MMITWSMSRGSLQHYALLAFSPHIPYDNDQALQLRKLHTLQVRRLHCDSLLYPRCLGTTFCPSPIDSIASCRITNFTPVFCGAQKFPVHYTRNNCKFGMRLAKGLDGPGIESRRGRDFPRLSRLALGPTQPPAQCVPGLSRWQSGRGAALTTHPHLTPRLKKE